MIEFHKNGDGMAVVTTAPDEDTFVEHFCEALSDLIEAGKYDGDWQFQLRYWLRNFADLVAAYRGYKVDVIERRTLIAGRIDPGARVLTVDDRGSVELEKHGG